MDKQELVNSEMQVKTIEPAKAASATELNDGQREHEHVVPEVNKQEIINAAADMVVADRETAQPPTGNAQWKGLYAAIAKYAQELKASR